MGFGKEVIRGGVTFGSALAMVLSYVEHQSVFWAIVHGVMSWLYVIYYVIVYRIF